MLCELIVEGMSVVVNVMLSLMSVMVVALTQWCQFICKNKMRLHLVGPCVC